MRIRSWVAHKDEPSLNDLLEVHEQILPRVGLCRAARKSRYLGPIASALTGRDIVYHDLDPHACSLRVQPLLLAQISHLSWKILAQDQAERTLAIPNLASPSGRYFQAPLINCVTVLPYQDHIARCRDRIIAANLGREECLASGPRS